MRKWYLIKIFPRRQSSHADIPVFLYYLYDYRKICEILQLLLLFRDQEY